MDKETGPIPPTLQEPIRPTPHTTGQRGWVVRTFLRLTGTLELTIDVILVLFGAYEILPHMTPEPALVYSVERDGIQGDVREVTTFRNPTSNWALHNVKTQWRVDSGGVRLVPDSDTPPNSVWPVPPVSQPSSNDSLQLSLNEPLPAEHSFKVYLVSKQSFLVVGSSFSAATLQVTSFGSYFQPVEPLSQNSWNTRVYKSYVLLVSGVIVFACFVGLFHKGLEKLSGRLT